MSAHPHFVALDRLKTRIQGLRSKTTDNGCTEAEALLAAAKVAEAQLLPHGRDRPADAHWLCRSPVKGRSAPGGLVVA